FTAGILMDSDQRRNASAFSKYFANAVTRRLRRNHAYINIFWWSDGAETNVESVREHQRLPSFQIGLDIAFVNFGLRGIGDQNHDHIRPLGSFSYVGNF